jgi:hypothetical protein
MRLIGCPAAILARVSVRKASGLTPFNFAVCRIEYIAAARSPPEWRKRPVSTGVGRDQAAVSWVEDR